MNDELSPEQRSTPGAGRPLPRGDAVPNEGWMFVPGKGALLAPRTIPFAFPSLAHLDERAADARKRMIAVEALSEKTVVWAMNGYRVFRMYLTETQSEKSFLAGELDVQMRVMEGWIAWLRTGGRSRVTVNNYWRALSILFVRIQRETGMVNPLVFLATPKIPKREAHYLTRDAAERVLAFVQHHDWGSEFERRRNLALVALLLLCGLRRGEAVKLRFGDVDLVSGVIHIRDGKGPGGGKDRTCQMNTQLRAILGAYVAIRRTRGSRDGAFLLAANRDGGIGTGGVVHLFKKISEAVGLRVTPHALRHTYATLLRQAGVPDRIAMELLGHTSLRMLQRYSHVYSGEREAAAERLVLDIDVPAAPMPETFDAYGV